MTNFEINPRYRDALERLQCTTAERLLARPAVAVTGHSDRNVSRLFLGDEPDAPAVYLKCEHRVRLSDRLSNFLAGFGAVSRAAREVQVLCELQAAGIGCAEWIAHGEDDSGRAFLLLRELTGFQDLRRFLHVHRESTQGLRRRLACNLGRELARIHDAGFEQPDLCAKHVMLNDETEEICFLDWQRARRHEVVPWWVRCRDLAALDATLAAELTSPRERLACLLAYLRAHRRAGATRAWRRPACRTIVQEIQALSLHLQRKRHIRDQRSLPLPERSQEIVRLDGEALCVAWRFWNELNGRWPEALNAVRQPMRFGRRLSREVITLPTGRQALLQRRRGWRPLRWLWSAFGGRRQESPELRQACLLNRRQGDGPPRLLAYGQRQLGLWRMESFLLTELPGGDVDEIATPFAFLSEKGEKNGRRPYHELGRDKTVDCERAELQGRFAHER